ncbi:hypothetical protein K438DRAFT_750428 [Mycena galopus ATCC 62051]|nr:hypothetical protein K438DRAFT_750428 [Mycena galopus ATCC 62051]
MTMVQENDTQRERKDSTRSRKDSTRSTRSRRDSTASRRDEREHRDDRDREKGKSRESHHSDGEGRDHSDHHHRRRSHHSHHHDDGDREKSHSDNEHKGRDSLKINTASAYTPEFLHALANGNSPTKSEFDVLTGVDAVRFTKKFVRNQRASGTAIPDELSAVAASAPHATPHAPMHTPSATSHVSLTNDTDPKAIDKKLKRSLQPVVFAFPRSAAGGAGRRVVDFYMSWRGKTVCAFPFLSCLTLSFRSAFLGFLVFSVFLVFADLGGALRLAWPLVESWSLHFVAAFGFALLFVAVAALIFLVPVLGLGLQIFFLSPIMLRCDAYPDSFHFFSFCAFYFYLWRWRWRPRVAYLSFLLSTLSMLSIVFLFLAFAVHGRPCLCLCFCFVSSVSAYRMDGRAVRDARRGSMAGLPDGRRRARPSPIPLPSHRILVSIAAVVPSYAYAYVVSHPTHAGTHTRMSTVRSRPYCGVVRDRDKRSEAQRAALIHSFHSHSFVRACAALGLGDFGLWRAAASPSVAVDDRIDGVRPCVRGWMR